MVSCQNCRFWQDFPVKYETDSIYFPDVKQCVQAIDYADAVMWDDDYTHIITNQAYQHGCFVYGGEYPSGLLTKPNFSCSAYVTKETLPPEV